MGVGGGSERWGGLERSAGGPEKIGRGHRQHLQGRWGAGGVHGGGGCGPGGFGMIKRVHGGKGGLRVIGLEALSPNPWDQGLYLVP